MATAILLYGTQTPKDIGTGAFVGKMLVRPAVTLDEYQMSVTAFLSTVDQPDKLVDMWRWGLVMPHDLMACWRGMLIIEQMHSLHNGGLCDAYYAGMRDLSEAERSYLDRVISQIGRETYDAIMARAVPEDVVTLFFRLAQVDKALVVESITGEVEVGTLNWRDDFVQLGVKHPKEVLARDAAIRRILDRYEGHLAAYAKSHRYPRQCMIMWDVEGLIVSALERGIEVQYGEDVVLGISIARAYGASAALVAFAGFDDDDGIRHSVDRGIQEASLWLRSHFTTGWFFRRPKRSLEEYEALLKQLDVDWMKMPVTHQLVT